jgi:diaminopimelate epimerase
MTGPAFIKMHGLGNDFVVLDGRDRPLELTAERARRLADRHTGVGCDQVVTMEPPRDPRAQLFMNIRNADGGTAGACGNAARCVARLFFDASGKDEAIIETPSGLVAAWRDGSDRVTVDMGPARLDWREIPLAREMDTLHLPVSCGPLSDAVAVGMGNPHAVFFVDDVSRVPLDTCGPALERDPLFPERANVGVAQVLSRRHLRLRVWERGAGVTLACGTGACAAVVAAVRRGLAEREATVTLDGGDLSIHYREDGHVFMSGPAKISFHGAIDDVLWQ